MFNTNTNLVLARRSRSRRGLLVASLAIPFLPLVARSQDAAAQEQRLLLALQKPNVTDVGEGFATVEFESGPNLSPVDYSVACYLQDADIPTTNCGAVVSAGLEPVGTASGTAGRRYSTVTATVGGLPSNVDVDCFVEVGGGLFGGVTKCQLAGSFTSALVPPGTPVPGVQTPTLVARPTDDPTEMLVIMEEPSRAAFGSLLGSLLGPIPGSLRALDITYKVQCLPTPASGTLECDTSSPTLWTDAPDLFTTGQVVSGLEPNTLYTCFASAVYVQNGVTEYACSPAEVDDENVVEPTPPMPPTAVEVEAGPPASLAIVVSATVPSGPQGTANPVLGYAVQCLDASVTAPAACQVDGAWSATVLGTELGSGVPVGDLDAETDYVCFAATVYGETGSEEYSCSSASASVTTGPDSSNAGRPTATSTRTLQAETTSITVEWMPGEQSIPAADDPSFAVECVADGAACPSTPTFNIDRPSGATPTATTVPGLTPGTSYDCYAIAKNWDGSAVCSEKGDVTLNRNAGSPTITSTICPPSVDAAAATIDSVTGSVTATSIDVTWTAGADSTPAATGTDTFYVGCVPSAGAACPTGVAFDVARPGSGSATTTTTVGGLTPETSYVCYVVAKNWNGAEVCSVASSAVSTAAGTSAGAPTIDSVVSSIDGTSVAVTWSPGTASVPAAADPSFYVGCVAGAGASCPTGVTFDVVRPSTASAVTAVGGLSPGTNYACFVAAKNWNGAEVCSSASIALTGSLSVDAAAATVDSVTGSVTATSIDVTWTAGVDSTPAATGTDTFYVGCVPSAGAACPTGVTFDVARPGSGSATTTVGGLTPETSYVCYVVAKNWNGAEVCSVASSAVSTAAGTSAGAPTIDSVVSSIDGTSVAVTWSPGAASVPAAAEPSFYVGCVAAGAACPNGVTFDVVRPPTAPAVTYVGGLSPGTSYDCFVVAKNWDGTEVCSIRPFFLDANGVTVKCPGVDVGATFTLGGVTYTRRDRAGLLALVAGNDAANLATSCTTGVTDMSALLQGKTTLNPDLSSWDTGAVTNMADMFYVAAAFNQEISYWNTGAVTTMERMFAGATSFNNGDPGNNGAKPLDWEDTSQVRNMVGMFDNAAAFNQAIITWDTGAVTTMSYMFNVATVFNQDVSAWNTGAVRDMSYMFYYAEAFNNGDPGNNGDNPLDWTDTSQVTAMNGMFLNAAAFNQDVSTWNTARVTNMGSMFSYATAFNNGDQGNTGANPLDWADTSKVENMNNMFRATAAFNQDVSAWTASPTECSNFATGADAWLGAYSGTIRTTPPLSQSMIDAGCGP